MTYIVIGAIINLSNEREVIKMKKVISIVCVLGLMVGVLCVGHQQRVEATTTEEETIYTSFKLLLTNREEYDKMSLASNPYGDGFASKRIVDVL